MPVTGFDHVSLPSADPDATMAFYKKLGFGTIHEKEWCAGEYPLIAIQIGLHAKINFPDPAPWQDPSFEAKGPTAKPGGEERGTRMGSSVYTRGPDGNLTEFMTDPASGRGGGWSDRAEGNLRRPV